MSDITITLVLDPTFLLLWGLLAIVYDVLLIALCLTAVKRLRRGRRDREPFPAPGYGPVPTSR